MPPWHQSDVPFILQTNEDESTTICKHSDFSYEKLCVHLQSEAMWAAVSVEETPPSGGALTLSGTGSWESTMSGM